MKDEPLVSVIVPTYNRPGFLHRTLTSLLTESYKHIEVIVVNDAGEDVGNVVDSFKDKRLRYFTNDYNMDLAGTRNVGLMKCTGDYICLLDDDDIHLKYTLEFRLHMMQYLHAEIVYTRALQSIMEAREGRYVITHQQLYWDSPFDRDLILIQNIAPCCCPLFSRKALEKADCRFDETLTTSEDWAFWVELSRFYDFEELKVVDCECSYRTDSTQMTGTRKGFTDHLPYLYGKWRKYATDLDWVVRHQNASLTARGLNPQDFNL